MEAISPKMETKDMNLSEDLNEVVRDFKPYVIKDVLCLTPGRWNNLNLSRETIIEGFNRTDWTDKKNFELIYDHDDKNASSWVGNLINRRVTQEGKVYGDLEVYDKDLAIKLGTGKAKLGVSAGLKGLTDGRNYYIGSFRNFSVVSDPACKEAFINLSEGNSPEFVETAGIPEVEEPTVIKEPNQTNTKGDDKQNKMEEIVSTGQDSAEELSSTLNSITSKLESFDAKLAELAENQVKPEPAPVAEPVVTPVPAPVVEPVAAPVAAPVVDNSALEEVEKLKAELAALKVQQAAPAPMEVVTNDIVPEHSFDKKTDLEKLIDARMSRLIN